MGSNPMRCARRAYESILTIVSAPQDVPKIRFRQSKLWCTRDREASAYKVPPTYLQSFSIPPNLQFQISNLEGGDYSGFQPGRGSEASVERCWQKLERGGSGVRRLLPFDAKGGSNAQAASRPPLAGV